MNGLAEWLGDGDFTYPVFDLYQRNHSLVDFVLFTVLFTAVAWAGLRHRLPGRPGRVVAACAGITLSLSLTLTMAARNLSLADLSWLAALLLSLIAALVAATLAKRSGVGVPTGGGLAAVIFALFLASAFDTPKWPISIEPLVSLAAVVLIGRLFFALAAGGPSAANGHAHGDAVPADERAPRALVVGTEQAAEHNHGLGRQMERLRGLATRQPEGPRARDELSAAVEEAQRSEAELAGRLTRIARLARRLEWQDAGVYARLKKAVRRADVRLRPVLARQLVFEWAKIEEEEKVCRLAHAAVHHARRIRHDLGKAKHDIRADRGERAARRLAVAGKRQEMLGALLAELAKWELRLEEIARRQEAERAGLSP